MHHTATPAVPAGDGMCGHLVMLSTMRSLSQHWFGRAILGVVLGFIILSFAVWGIGDRFTGFNANELAKVGSGWPSATTRSCATS